MERTESFCKKWNVVPTIIREVLESYSEGVWSRLEPGGSRIFLEVCVNESNSQIAFDELMELYGYLKEDSDIVLQDTFEIIKDET